MTVACGIDFGTSNSAIAVVNHHGPVLVELEEDSTTLPSAMFFPAHNHDVFYGREAIKQFLNHEEGRFMRSLKRVLGTSLMTQGTVVNGRRQQFSDIIGAFLQHMKVQADVAQQQDITDVVLGRPVHFVDGDPAADALAQDQLEAMARACGFSQIAFQYEPVAAAYAHEAAMQQETLAMVVDIGGGTSDFTIIRLGKTHRDHPDRSDDILANTGVRVGGNDFDKWLSVDAFMPELGLGTTYGPKGLHVPKKPFHDLSEWSTVNFLYTHAMRNQMQGILRQSDDEERFQRVVQLLEEETGHILLQAVEDAKIALSEKDSVRADLTMFSPALSLDVTRKAFEASGESVVQSMQNCAHECLTQAGILASQIQLLIFTGGSTEIPAVQLAFRQIFPDADISEGNKLSSVATGLAYEAQRIFGI